MKIMFFIYSLGAGGAERVMSLLANDWAAQGHRITIATLTPKVKPFYKLHDAVEVIHLGVSAVSQGFSDAVVGNYRRIMTIKHAIVENDPDVVIAFMTATNVLTILASKLAKKPVVVSEHINFYGGRSKVWRLLRRIVYPFSDALTVLTEHDKGKYTYHSNIHVMPNPLVLEHKHHNIPRQKLILGVGRLQLHKGFSQLLKAFSRLDNEEWRVVILGEGPERANLEEQIAVLKLQNRVALPGRVSDVEKYYKKASIFVLPSSSEGFPMALIEAMGYGCAAVAYDCLTGPSDIIDNDVNGILLKVGDVDKLTKTLQTLIDHPEKRERVGRNAEKIVDNLKIENITKRWFEILHRVLKNDEPL